MTDMEALEKWDEALDHAVERIWNGGSRETIRDILNQVRTEAHRDGMETRRDIKEYGRVSFNQGMEKVLAVLDDVCGFAEADIARSVRGKINDLPGTREKDSSEEVQGDIAED